MKNTNPQRQPAQLQPPPQDFWNDWQIEIVFHEPVNGSALTEALIVTDDKKLADASKLLDLLYATPATSQHSLHTINIVPAKREESEKSQREE